MANQLVNNLTRRVEDIHISITNQMQDQLSKLSGVELQLQQVEDSSDRLNATLVCVENSTKQSIQQAFEGAKKCSVQQLKIVDDINELEASLDTLNATIHSEKLSTKESIEELTRRLDEAGEADVVKQGMTIIPLFNGKFNGNTGCGCRTQ